MGNTSNVLVRQRGRFLLATTILKRLGRGLCFISRSIFFSLKANGMSDVSSHSSKPLNTQYTSLRQGSQSIASRISQIASNERQLKSAAFGTYQTGMICLNRAGRFYNKLQMRPLVIVMVVFLFLSQLSRKYSITNTSL